MTKKSNDDKGLDKDAKIFMDQILSLSKGGGVSFTHEDVVADTNLLISAVIVRHFLVDQSVKN